MSYIDNGLVTQSMAGYPNQPEQWKWLNMPASYHNGAGNLAFADNHVESKKWKDPRTKPPLSDTT